MTAHSWSSTSLCAAVVGFLTVYSTPLQSAAAIVAIIAGLISIIKNFKKK